MMQGAHAFNVLITKNILKEGLNTPKDVNELYEHLLRHSQHGVFLTHDHIALVQTVRQLMNPTLSHSQQLYTLREGKSQSSSLEEKLISSFPLNIVENKQPTIISLTDRQANNNQQIEGKQVSQDRRSQDRRDALDAFEMYVELINLIKTLEPELVTKACRVLKKNLFPNFSLKPFQSIKSLYPEFTPDVFYRLWHTRLEPRELL